MHVEQLKKEFFNQLISLNSLAELISDDTTIDKKIIEKLQDRCLKVYHQLVMLELNANSLTVQTPNNINNNVLAALQTMDTSTKAENSSEQISTHVKEINEELSNLFTSETASKQIEEFNKQTFKPISEENFVTDVITKIEPIVKKFPSLKQFLGFNDKLQIQQILFTNNTEQLNTFITTIDNCSTSMQAINVISTYKNQYHWDNEDDVFVSLITAIEQKYR